MDYNFFNDCEDAAQLLGQFGGACSTCWENVAAAGVFDSTKAAWLVTQAIARLEQLNG